MTQTATLASRRRHRSPISPPLKTRQQAAWSSGDYAVVGTTLQIVGEELVRSARSARRQQGARRRRRQRQRHARRGAPLVRRDLDRLRAGAARARPRARRRRAAHGRVPRGRRRSAAVRAGELRRRGLDLRRDVHADQDKAAAELLRVCKPGGKIGLANWTPDGFIGQLFKTIGKHLPPPAGVKSPALWGTRARIAEMFGAAARSITSPSRGCSCSAIARRSTGSTCSRPTTARC